MAMLPVDHRITGSQELRRADLADEPRLRCDDPGPDDVPIRAVEELDAEPCSWPGRRGGDHRWSQRSPKPLPRSRGG
ncbi:hypothetical protein [Streptomyces canus]|uniref:hypothetical protein n=1 Tax=Streptomyces canus TaxID=58343 RepID=UPI0036ED1D31